MAISFLSKDEILQLHQWAIDDVGGSNGLRDEGLLDSAIAQPETSFGGAFLHDTIFLMAAAYFFHISQNQPFTDGNKRTGFLSMYSFLKRNSYNLDVPNETIYPVLLEVANGLRSKKELATFVEQHSHLEA